MKRWRVNFGQGQVSHRMGTRREAAAYIEACKAHNSDDARGFFIEHQDADGWWMPMRTQRKAVAS